MSDFDVLHSRLQTYLARMKKLEDGPEPGEAPPEPGNGEYAMLCEKVGKLRFQLDRVHPDWD